MPKKTTYDRFFHPSAARRLIEKGMDEPSVAARLGIAPGTLSRWKAAYPEFAEAMTGNGELLDCLVESALLRRAAGYDYAETVYDFDRGTRKFVPVKRTVKHSAPEYSAAVFWLKQCCPARWSDKKAAEPPMLANFLEEMRHI